MVVLDNLKYIKIIIKSLKFNQAFTFFEENNQVLARTMASEGMHLQVITLN